MDPSEGYRVECLDGRIIDASKTLIHPTQSCTLNLVLESMNDSTKKGDADTV